jgi:hypothetical protein
MPNLCDFKSVLLIDRLNILSDIVSGIIITAYICFCLDILICYHVKKDLWSNDCVFQTSKLMWDKKNVAILIIKTDIMAPNTDINI